MLDQNKILTLSTKLRTGKLPDAPGVYLFKDAKKNILYIGKATSLRSRVRSYFNGDLADKRSPWIAQMIEQVDKVDYKQTDSVLEALILEANLIRSHKPRYNTDLKDDKSFTYVVITREDFPRVLLVRGKELEKRHKSKIPDTPTPSLASPVSYLHVFGPFPHGAQLKEALRIIRKIFPYRDTCVPCEQQSAEVTPRRKHVCKPCFNRHIGLCPGVCSGEISKTEYRKIIRRITLLFQGKKPQLLQSLERDMRQAARAERFEEAARLRGQTFALQHIQDVSLIKHEYRSPSTSLGATRSTRIEAYDAAHLQGRAAVGVMTVVAHGEAQKGEYRKFILRATKAGDDAGALREILSRRLAHAPPDGSWQLPRLIVVDGSTAQLGAAAAVLAEHGIQLPIVGVVKDERHRPRAIRVQGHATDASLGSQAALLATLGVSERDILLANAEAHRYAISFHRARLRAAALS